MEVNSESVSASLVSDSERGRGGELVGVSMLKVEQVSE